MKKGHLTVTFFDKLSGAGIFLHRPGVKRKEEYG